MPRSFSLRTGPRFSPIHGGCDWRQSPVREHWEFAAIRLPRAAAGRRRRTCRVEIGAGPNVPPIRAVSFSSFRSVSKTSVSDWAMQLRTIISGVYNCINYRFLYAQIFSGLSKCRIAAFRSHSISLQKKMLVSSLDTIQLFGVLIVLLTFFIY